MKEFVDTATARRAAAWDDQLRKYRASIYECGSGLRRPVSGWESESDAVRYWNNVQTFQKDRIERLLGMLSPCAGLKVLDVGSGPGVLAVPLAERGALVTAVDPSPGMISVLEARKREKGLSAISCLNMPWEEVVPERDLDGPYDAVIASLSLMMDDIRTSLLKMKEVCRGRVYLVWANGGTTWEKHVNSIRGLLDAGPYIPRPGAELLPGIIGELGYEPEVTTAPFPYAERFASRAAALEHMRGYFGVREDGPTGLLSGYLDTCLEQRDGAFVLDLPASVSIISW